MAIDEPSHACPPGPQRSAAATRPATRLAAALAACLAILALSVGPAAAADPARSSGVPVATTATTAGARTRTVDLYRSRATVRQYTSYYCVPAATQTMLNIVLGRSDRSVATQARLYAELRRANLYRYRTNGNDVRGWARVLTARLPAGKGYGDVSFGSQAAAYAAIVEAIDRTNRPVGIVVDRGSHAWTVVGFTVRETPGPGGGRTILGFTVVGPLGSPRDPWPKRYLTVAQLNARFTRYHEAQRKVVWEGRYVIVAPIGTVGGVEVPR